MDAAALIKQIEAGGGKAMLKTAAGGSLTATASGKTVSVTDESGGTVDSDDRRRQSIERCDSRRRQSVAAQVTRSLQPNAALIRARRLILAVPAPVTIGRWRKLLDVLIIGAGHNGLTCACYLAAAGLSVRVVERRNVVGGAAVTEEFYPGFRNSTASYTVSLLNPQVIRDLKLAQHGLRIVERPFSNFVPLMDGRYLKFGGDAAQTTSKSRNFRRATPNDCRLSTRGSIASQINFAIGSCSRRRISAGRSSSKDGAISSQPPGCCCNWDVCREKGSAIWSMCSPRARATGSIHGLNRSR